MNVIGNIFVSNGMAAGNTMMEAKVQALSEICERHAKHQIIARGLCLPEIPAAVLNRYPTIVESLQSIQEYGYRIRVADASLGGIYPVVSVTLINPANGSVLTSFGAHPCFEVALERTVTELLQGRELNQLDGFQAPIFDLDEVASAQNIEMHFIDSSGDISNDFFRARPDYEYVDWNTETSTANEYQALVTLIHEQGFELYCAEYDHLGVPVCRIVVPGMSDIYPVDELVWENNNEGAQFREALLNLNNLEPEDWQALLDALEEAAHNDHTRLAQFIGLLPDENTLWVRLRLGEIKAMLSLALQSEVALDWVNWCLTLEDLSQEELRHYRCVKALLEIRWHPERKYEDYLDGLALLYGQATTQQAYAVVKGEISFAGLTTPRLSLEDMHLHQCLLTAYNKINQHKKAANSLN